MAFSFEWAYRKLFEVFIVSSKKCSNAFSFVMFTSVFGLPLHFTTYCKVPGSVLIHFNHDESGSVRLSIGMEIGASFSSQSWCVFQLPKRTYYEP